MVLKRNGVHRFTAQVIAAQSFVGKAVLFQRWMARKHRWSTVKTVFFGKRVAASTPVPASTASSVTFGARLPRLLKVRAVLPSGQAGPCYVSANVADDQELILPDRSEGQSLGPVRYVYFAASKRCWTASQLTTFHQALR